MLVDRDACFNLLRCPRQKIKLDKTSDGRLVSRKPGVLDSNYYEMVDGLPILVDFDRSILTSEGIKCSSASSPIQRERYKSLKKLVRFIYGESKAVTRRNMVDFCRLLNSSDGQNRVLIVGGGSIGQGLQPLYESRNIEIIAFDIYASPHIQFIADAHQIPLDSESFDAVIVQAVLEHVLEPSMVVDEIFRVLKSNGIVYAETPFMQQVHEGPYDFTRFSESGHRYLFRRFDCLSSGASSGPGTAFVWSAEYLARAIFRSNVAGKVVKALLLWMKLLDSVVPEKYSIDAASGVFFLGRKTEASLSPSEIVAHYKGAG